MMGRSAEGWSELVEKSVGTGVPTHTPGPALSNRVFPPTGSRTTLLAEDFAPSAQMLQHPPAR